MGLNERMLADLETGRTKFASAASVLQTIKDEIDQVAQNLSPEEEKWVGAASPQSQETLRLMMATCLLIWPNSTLVKN